MLLTLIGKDLISMAKFLKFFRGSTLIWMAFPCLYIVRFLNLRLICVRGNTEKVVVGIIFNLSQWAISCRAAITFLLSLFFDILDLFSFFIQSIIEPFSSIFIPHHPLRCSGHGFGRVDNSSGNLIGSNANSCDRKCDT